MVWINGAEEVVRWIGEGKMEFTADRGMRHTPTFKKWEIVSGLTI